jgi:hypothetical protein
MFFTTSVIFVTFTTLCDFLPLLRFLLDLHDIYDVCDPIRFVRPLYYFPQLSYNSDFCDFNKLTPIQQQSFTENDHLRVYF